MSVLSSYKMLHKAGVPAPIVQQMVNKHLAGLDALPVEQQFNDDVLIAKAELRQYHSQLNAEASNEH